MGEDKELEKKVENKLPDFEVGLPWYNIHNVNAAKARNLRYGRRSRVYRIVDGCPIRDKFGQPLG